MSKEETDLSAPVLPPPGSEEIERMAFALWREEARVGTPGTFNRRTWEVWGDQLDVTHARWRRFAQAAFAALAQPKEQPHA